MASPFQQQALQRKFVYLGLIAVLFTLSLAWRRYYVEARASELEIREQSRGEADLSGSVVRLTLTGSRGLATCVLWSNALDKQKKNQWNELELVVKSLTKLQPHFITPWLFQSWNLAYNVSVESDRVADKYFYITRGILLLGEGERQNRDNPDLRFHMGFYTANKMHISDETNVFRSLFQLSMIPPSERDPARFRTVAADGRQAINWGELEQFCKDHPQLVRRLREGIKRETKRELRRQFTCERPEDVVQFLADNFRVPSLYQEVPLAVAETWAKDPDPKKRDLEDRFPPLPPKRQPLPPQRHFNPGELTYDDFLGDDIDCHAVSRAWYGYAQEPLPDAGPLPGSNTDPINPARQRRPKNMTTLLFRNYPARAQSYLGERLEQEGWFDDEGWEVPGWFQRRNDVPAGRSHPVVLGGTDKWAQRAWEEAMRLWERTGQENKLILKPAEERNLREQAAAFERKYNLPAGSRISDDLRTDAMDQETQEQHFAAKFLWEYDFYRKMSNFAHHYIHAIIEAKDETIQARKVFYLADRYRFAGSPEQALEMYERPEGIRAWRDKVLLPNKEYRFDRTAQEDTYEIQSKYLDLFYEQYGRQLGQQLAQRVALMALAGQVALAGAGAGLDLVPEWYPLVALTRTNPYQDLELIAGPFDMRDSEGQPLVGPDVASLMEDRLADRTMAPKRRKAAPPAPPPPSPRSPPPTPAPARGSRSRPEK